VNGDAVRVDEGVMFGGGGDHTASVGGRSVGPRA
jgi:hypothetical protein